MFILKEIKTLFKVECTCQSENNKDMLRIYNLPCPFCGGY